MRISLVLAHPNKGSFNHSIAETALESLRSAGHYVRFHDLYEEPFAPVLRGAEIPLGAPLDAVLEAPLGGPAEAIGAAMRTGLIRVWTPGVWQCCFGL